MKLYELKNEYDQTVQTLQQKLSGSEYLVFHSDVLTVLFFFKN